MVHSLKDDPIAAQLVPLAWTPIGVVLGEGSQRVGVAQTGIFDWADRTFPADGDRAFVASLRDLELLLRIGWDSTFPERLDERSILNVEDVPDELLDALARPARTLVQCVACRRLCARDDFLSKERQLCAWDYHAQVFGRRGPWHDGAYEVRHFGTLPQCAYLVPELIEELGVEILLTLGAVTDETAHSLVRMLVAGTPRRSYMAVRTEKGIALLAERAA